MSLLPDAVRSFRPIRDRFPFGQGAPRPEGQHTDDDVFQRPQQEPILAAESRAQGPLIQKAGQRRQPEAEEDDKGEKDWKVEDPDVVRPDAEKNEEGLSQAEDTQQKQVLLKLDTLRPKNQDGAPQDCRYGNEQQHQKVCHGHRPVFDLVYWNAQ